MDTVILPIAPRSLQQPILDNKSRRKVIVAHRRFGKTTVALLQILKSAVPGTRHWYIAPCYDDSTEILTDSGWKYFKDVLLDDKVATLDRGRMVFENYIEKHVYPFNDELICYKDNFIDMAVTPNHRCYVKNNTWLKKRNWEIKEAKDIYNTDKYSFKKNCKWEGNTTSNKYWFELLGLWFADGSARLRGRNSGEVTITQKKYINYVETLLDQNGIDYRKDSRGDGNGFNYVIGGISMAKEFTKYGDSYTKALPGFIKDASPELLDSFLDGYWKGDGSYHKNKTRHRAITGSRQLANDIQEVAIKAGYSANIRSVKHLYTITLLGKQFGEVKLYKRNWFKKKYNGLVSCVETRTGVVMVRRNGVAYWCGNTYKQAKMIAWDMLTRKLLPRDLQKSTNSIELRVELTNGAIIELKGSDKPDSLRGAGLDGVVLDEYAQQDPRIFSEIVRPMLVDREGWALFIGTPKGKNHFFDLFYDTEEKDRYYFKASDTHVIKDEELADAKAEMSNEEYKQEFECEFLYFSGQIYKEFSRDRNIIKPYKTTDNMGLFGAGIDYGLVNPTCVLWYYVDYDGKVFIIDEHYESGKTVKHHCSRIRERQYNLRALPLLDPSAFGRTRAQGDRLYSVADEFSENGVPCLPAQNDVAGGINRVKEHFKNNKLFIFANCEKTIWELENYRWKDRKLNQNLPEEPLKLNDHAMDALRYIILSRPFKPPVPKYDNWVYKREQLLMKPSKKNQSWY